MNYNGIFFVVFCLAFASFISIIEKDREKILKDKYKTETNVDFKKNIRIENIEKQKIVFDLKSKHRVFNNFNIYLVETLDIKNPYSLFEIVLLNDDLLDKYRIILEGKLIDEKIEDKILNNIKYLKKKNYEKSFFNQTIEYVNFVIEVLKSRDLDYEELNNIVNEIKNVQSSIRVLRDYVSTKEVKYFLFSKLEKENNRYINVFNEFSDNN